MVYFEQYSDIRTAIDREKQLKGWRREKKEILVAGMNPARHDLSDGWYETQGPSTPLRFARDDDPVSGTK